MQVHNSYYNKLYYNIMHVATATMHPYDSIRHNNIDIMFVYT